jgi:hypothetical protein
MIELAFIDAEIKILDYILSVAGKRGTFQLLFTSSG